MKTIFRIAKTELRTLFYSPIAWFLMIVFFIQCAIAYLAIIKGVARTQELGGMEIMFLKRLTSGIFLSSRGVFQTVMRSLYLYIPLLTMSLISREMGSGTIKLLYSSPIKVREIVFGKYLAMMMYNLVLLGLLGVFIVTGLFNIQHVETGMLMTSILGFYLLLCAYAAIGLFMSTLTTYQVVAAIASFIMIGILSYIGLLWQRIAFVRDLTYFLSIGDRTQKMLNGLVTTKDVVYFIVIVYLFLGFSILRLKGGMESKPWSVKLLRYASLISVGLAVGYVTSIPGMIGYYDATINKNNTLIPKVQKIVKDLGDDPLEITVYNNLVDRYYYISNPDTYNDNLARWDDYFRFKDNIKIKTVNYYDSAYASAFIYSIYPGKTLKEIADQNAKKYDMNLSDYLTPEEIRKQIDLRPENNRYVMQLKWKDKKAWLRVFDDPQIWPSETEIAVTLRRLQGAKIPRVGFITGHLERDIRRITEDDYAALTNTTSFRSSLVNQGFDVQTVSLDSADIPDDIATLVLADPKLDLSSEAKSRLENYINSGRNILIAGEPGRQNIINPILKNLGVQLGDGLLIEESPDQPALMIEQMTPYAGSMLIPVAQAIKDSTPVSMPGAAMLKWIDNTGFEVHPMLTTNPKTSWNRVKPFDPQFMIASVMDSTSAHQETIKGDTSNGHGKNLGIIRYSSAEGDVRGPHTTVLALKRKINNKEQRIVVAGDADFIGNKEIGRFGMANFIFSTGIFSWLSASEFPIDASRPEPLDKRINVTMKQADMLRIAYVWVVPALMLLAGAIILIRRKRK